MALVNISIAIPTEDLHRFYDGTSITLPTDKDLSSAASGDFIHWECAQFGGIAKVVSILPPKDRLLTEITLINS